MCSAMVLGELTEAEMHSGPEQQQNHWFQEISHCVVSMISNRPFRLLAGKTKEELRRQLYNVCPRCSEGAAEGGGGNDNPIILTLRLPRSPPNDSTSARQPHYQSAQQPNSCQTAVNYDWFWLIIFGAKPGILSPDSRISWSGRPTVRR